MRVFSSLPFNSGGLHHIFWCLSSYLWIWHHPLFCYRVVTQPANRKQGNYLLSYWEQEKFHFYFDQKELVRCICKKKSLHKHKEQKCPAAYLVPCLRGEGSWKTSLKLRPSMKQRLCFRKACFGWNVFSANFSPWTKKRKKKLQYFHVDERYLMIKSWGENKSVTVPFEDKHQPFVWWSVCKKVNNLKENVRAF